MCKRFHIFSPSLGKIAGTLAANHFVYLSLSTIEFEPDGNPLALSLHANPCSLLRQNRRSHSNLALWHKNAQYAYAVPGKNWSSAAKAGPVCCRQIQRPPYSKPRNGLQPGGRHLPGTKNCARWSSLMRKAGRLALLLFIASKIPFLGAGSPLCE